MISTLRAAATLGLDLPFLPFVFLFLVRVLLVDVYRYGSTVGVHILWMTA